MRTKGQQSNLVQFPTSHTPAPRPTITEDAAIEYVNFDRLFIPERHAIEVLDVRDACYGFQSGDKLVIDRSIMPGLRDFIIIKGEKAVHVTTYRELDGQPVYGVVTHVLRAFRGWNE